MSRPLRALYLSSPIGLGHAQRDLAIASQLRDLRPDVDIVWLAQHPVTAVLEAAGEQVHAASSLLASESGHVEGEAGEHDLHCFQPLRRMDEILIANFMVFADLCSDEHFDLVIADEAWDVDHFLHENPEPKRSALCWLTDFIGFLPMPDGGEREALVAADYNAEMVEHVARFARLRDRSVFSNRPSTSATDSTATVPAGAWTTRPPRRRFSLQPWWRSRLARSTNDLWNRTAPHVQPPSLLSFCRRSTSLRGCTSARPFSGARGRSSPRPVPGGHESPQRSPSRRASLRRRPVLAGEHKHPD
jgi:hypothetical protein